MYSWKDADDRVAIVQMNAELRHAQLDLLSAQCATDRLRLRFSVEDLAQYGERDVLRKAIGTAVALSDYYLSIQNQLPTETSSSLTESHIREAVKAVSDYLWKEREAYRQKGVALTERQKADFRPFFSEGILDRVRTVQLHGKRVSPPPFYMQAQVMGINNLPAVSHMASLTFVDVIVFNDLIIERALFHGLVHAVQFQILGLERYTDLFVRGFLRTNAHFSVPLESHAFALESKFALNPEQPFSVEERVRLWLREGRY
jgi:hypothetical protein